MKKALLVISFGTSYAETREKNIESCEKQLAAAFPGRDFFRAFTSGMIIRKLKSAITCISITLKRHYAICTSRVMRMWLSSHCM